MLHSGIRGGESEPAEPAVAAYAHGRVASTGHGRGWPNEAKTPRPRTPKLDAIVEQGGRNVDIEYPQ